MIQRIITTANRVISFGIINCCVIFCFLIFFNTFVEANQFSLTENSSECVKINNGAYGPEVISFLCKDFSQRVSHFIKFFSPISAYGETITYQKAEQQCY